MSYSFSLCAATKAEAKALVAAKLDEVVANQPSHQVDQAQAHAAACSFIDALPEDDSRDIAVSVHGNVSWVGAWGVDHQVRGAGIGISVNLADRTA